MNKLKKTATFCAAVILGLSVLSGCSKKEDTSSKSTATTTVKSTTTSKAVTTITTTSTRPTLNIPELSCSKISFGGEYTIFPDSNGRLRLINADYQEVTKAKVQDDDGNTVDISCEHGHITFMRNEKNITEFLFNRHSVMLKDNSLFFDGSPVTYTDSSFYSYKLTDKLTLECVAGGNFVLRDENGKASSTGNVTDDSKISMKIEIDKDGIWFMNSNDEVCPCFKINDDLFVVTGKKVIINGKTMCAQHSYDIQFSATTVSTKATSTTTKKANQSTTKATTTTTATTTTVPQIAVPKPSDTIVTTSPHNSDMTNQDISDETTEMLEYVNEIRKQYGLSELYGLSVLDDAAQTRADELEEAYSHLRPDDLSFDTVLDDNGITWFYSAENIASGSPGLTKVSDVFDLWMSSDSHRANILDSKMKYMAVAKSTAVVDGKPTTYWEQLFFNDQYVPDK